jgi:hypothetical protein
VDRVVLKTFWLETRPEDGWQRVRTTIIDPKTREPVEVEATEDEWRRWLPAQGRGRDRGRC